MDSIKSADNDRDARHDRASLDDRYGKIGISAVAAAVRYQSESDTPAPAYRARYVPTND